MSKTETNWVAWLALVLAMLALAVATTNFESQMAVWKTINFNHPRQR